MQFPPTDRAVEGILWYIQHHQLAGGDRLPAERVLCEEIGVSRTALRAGITRLISCGTLESRRGSGTGMCVLPNRSISFRKRITSPMLCGLPACIPLLAWFPPGLSRRMRRLPTSLGLL